MVPKFGSGKAALSLADARRFQQMTPRRRDTFSHARNLSIHA
jgi:hypothetical protein